MRNNGGCCLSRIVEFILVIVMIIVVVSFFSEDEKKDQDKQVSVHATQKPYVTDGIKGSNAYDITVGLKDQGFGEPERKKTKDGYVFEGSSDNAYGFYQYFILADENFKSDYAIRYAYFSFKGENNNFLEACIGMTIGNGSEAEAMKSIQNLNEYGESKTNDTTYYYAPVENDGGILEIASSAYDGWIMRENNE